MWTSARCDIMMSCERGQHVAPLIGVLFTKKCYANREEHKRSRRLQKVQEVIRNYNRGFKAKLISICVMLIVIVSEVVAALNLFTLGRSQRCGP